MLAALQPYRAVFSATFAQMLQYRVAAVAGFATQCWWGTIKVLVLAAFYRSGAGEPPISLTQAVTYTWLAQGFLVLLPWNADPEVAAAMRSGAVAYDRLRPIDTGAGGMRGRRPGSRPGRCRGRR